MTSQRQRILNKAVQAAAIDFVLDKINHFLQANPSPDDCLDIAMEICRLKGIIPEDVGSLEVADCIFELGPGKIRWDIGQLERYKSTI